MGAQADFKSDEDEEKTEAKPTGIFQLGEIVGVVGSDGPYLTLESLQKF